jgi:photosystem II stability/assembly factor-like uncharacterized protein
MELTGMKKFVYIFVILSAFTVFNQSAYSQYIRFQENVPANPDEPLIEEDDLRDISLEIEGINPDWKTENPKLNSEYMYDIQHLSNSLVLAVGQSGTILRSVDGGVAWTLIPTSFNVDLRAISFINSDTIVIAGNSGFFAISIDQGLTWTQKSTGTTQNLATVAFLPNYKIIAGGYSKTNLISDDLGNTWNNLGIPDSVVSNPNNKTTWTYYNISFTSSDTLFIGVDGTGMTIQVLRSTDGGATFSTSVASGITPPNTSLGLGVQSIRFASDKMTGFACYRSGISGNVIKTTDAGLTWEKIIDSFTPLPGPSPYTTQTIQIRYSIDVSADGLFIVTGGLFGQVLTSTDGGINWEEKYGGVRQGDRDFAKVGFRGASIASDKSWLVAGKWGLIAGSPSPSGNPKISNGIDLPISIRDVTFINDQLGFAVGFQEGERYINSQGGTEVLAIGAFYTTTDGGTIWNREVGPGQENVRWNSIRSNSSGKIWVAGLSLDQFNDIWGVIRYSSDYGVTWVEQHRIPGEIASLTMLDENNLAAVNFGPNLIKTTNGGSSWETVIVPVPNYPNSYLFDVELLTPDVLIAVTGHGSGTQAAHILKSTNAGAAWTSKFSSSTGRFKSVNFIDAKLGFVTGWFGATLSRKSLIRSSDGGETWTELVSPTTTDIASSLMLNKSLGFAVGSNGIHYKTENGINWLTAESIFSENANKISRSGNKVRATGFAATLAKFNPPMAVNIAPGKFYNVYPPENYTVTIADLPVKFCWTKSSDPENTVNYTFVFFDSLKNELSRYNANTDTFYIFSSQLGTLPKTLLYWNVEANDGADTVYSYMSRFILDQSVPVELTSFSYSLTDNNVNLMWSTATEANNKGFEVRRSENNNDFETIAFIEGSGTSADINNYMYTDKNLIPGSYYYRIIQIDFDGTYSIYSLPSSIEILPPDEFSISQNYPNPFNPLTNIKYQLPANMFVSIKIYDIIGNEISSLINREQPAGSYELNFDAGNLPSGVYLYRIIAGPYNITRKMLLMK